MKTGNKLAGWRCSGIAVQRFFFCGLAVFMAVSVGAQTWSANSQTVIVGGPAQVQVEIDSLTPQTKRSRPLPTIVSGTTIPGTGPGIWPALSPEGKNLAYLADSTKLTLLDMTTHQGKTLSDHAVSPVAWSPDSQFFAYARTDEKGTLEYCSAHANGDLAVSVTLPFSKVTTGTMQTISWVPTTDNAIIAGGDGAKTDLYLIDQGQVVQLTNTGDVQGFSVSADGERVRWVRRSPNTHYILLSIYDLIISKRTALKLDFPDRLRDINPQPRRSVDAVTSVVFSPSLDRMAFVTRGGSGDGANGSSLYECDIHGKNIHLLTKGKVMGQAAVQTKPVDNNQPPLPPAIPAPVTPGVQSAAMATADMTGLTSPSLVPTFSPDSRQLCVLQTEGDKRYLMIFDADGNSRRVGMLP